VPFKTDKIDNHGDEIEIFWSVVRGDHRGAEIEIERFRWRMSATKSIGRRKNILASSKIIHGTRKMFPEYGSFTLLPDGYPVTSTYFVGSAGLKTYPGRFGTGCAVGNCAGTFSTRGDDGG
jgi:hypothetical protein